MDAETDAMAFCGVTARVGASYGGRGKGRRESDDPAGLCVQDGAGGSGSGGAEMEAIVCGPVCNGMRVRSMTSAWSAVLVANTFCCGKHPKANTTRLPWWMAPPWQPSLCGSPPL